MLVLHLEAEVDIRSGYSLPRCLIVSLASSLHYGATGKFITSISKVRSVLDIEYLYRRLEGMPEIKILGKQTAN